MKDGNDEDCIAPTPTPLGRQSLFDVLLAGSRADCRQLCCAADAATAAVADCICNEDATGLSVLAGDSADTKDSLAVQRQRKRNSSEPAALEAGGPITGSWMQWAEDVLRPPGPEASVESTRSVEEEREKDREME